MPSPYTTPSTSGGVVYGGGKMLPPSDQHQWLELTVTFTVCYASLAHLVFITSRYNEWYGFLSQIEMARMVFDMNMIPRLAGNMIFVVCKELYIAGEDLQFLRFSANRDFAPPTRYVNVADTRLKCKGICISKIRVRCPNWMSQ